MQAGVARWVRHQSAEGPQQEPWFLGFHEATDADKAADAI